MANLHVSAGWLFLTVSSIYTVDQFTLTHLRMWHSTVELNICMVLNIISRYQLILFEIVYILFRVCCGCLVPKQWQRCFINTFLVHYWSSEFSVGGSPLWAKLLLDVLTRSSSRQWAEIMVIVMMSKPTAVPGLQLWRFFSVDIFFIMSWFVRQWSGEFSKESFGDCSAFWTKFPFPGYGGRWLTSLKQTQNNVLFLGTVCFCLHPYYPCGGKLMSTATLRAFAFVSAHDQHVAINLSNTWKPSASGFRCLIRNLLPLLF